MWSRSIFDVVKPRSPHSPARGASRRATPSRLQLEPLEDRCLLSFNPAVNYDVAAYPLDLVVGDFNGDGKTDQVTINATQVSVLPGNGDGTFGDAQTTTVGSGMSSVATGHFNGGGWLDLA